MKYGVLIAASFSLRKPFLQAAHERARLDLVLSSWAAVAACWNSDSELARSRSANRPGAAGGSTGGWSSIVGEAERTAGQLRNVSGPRMAFERRPPFARSTTLVTSRRKTRQE